MTNSSEGITFGGTRSSNTAEVCGAVTVLRSRCAALVRLDTPKIPDDAPPDAIQGYHPADLVSAYNLPTLFRGFGQTIAIVIAFDDPVAGLDMERFRSKFGLPACTKADGCYKKVNQFGNTSGYPPPNADWAVGASVSLDVASGTCPNCHLLLVEAKDDTDANLATAVMTAAHLGANVIDITYYGYDSSQNAKYNHPGKIVVAPVGQAGYTTQVAFPGGSRYVVAVGATFLARASNARGWVDKTWADTGSGCGTEPKPSWQNDSLCSHRMIVDVSADGAPSPGVATYDTYHEPGWISVYGTGVSATIVSGAYALAANEGQLTYARGLYVRRNQLFDVTQGDNGHCGGTYLCTAKPGYDGPTGNGTPNGIGAF